MFLLMYLLSDTAYIVLGKKFKRKTVELSPCINNISFSRLELKRTKLGIETFN